MLDFIHLLASRGYTTPVTHSVYAQGGPTKSTEVTIIRNTITEITPTQECHQKFNSEIYPKALKELKELGFCRPSFDPYNDPYTCNPRVIIYYQDKDGVDLIEGIEHLKSGELKGFMILSDLDDDARELHIDFFYIIPEHRGAGEGHKFMKLFIEHFKEYKSKFISLSAEIYLNNGASDRVFSEAGFEPYSMSMKYKFEGEAV